MYVYGRDYLYSTAAEFHAVCEPGESWDACADQDYYYDMELRDYHRALKERVRLRDAIVDSAHLATFSATFPHTVVVGCACDIDVYYAYCQQSCTMWVYGYSSEAVVDIFCRSETGKFPQTLHPTMLQQAIRKLFLHAEFKFQTCAESTEY